MFLSLLQRRNPGLLEAAARLHADGLLPANTAVIDLDAVERNSAALAAESARLGLTPFAMTKQIGRNPDAAAAIRAGGITEAVGVDLECSIAAAAGGLGIGHLGHLVQIPRAGADAAAALAPRFWTVFSEHKAREAGAAALRAGRVQDLLVRVTAPGDRFYRGHEGGVPAEGIAEFADLLDSIPGVRFRGVTSFPATLADPETGRAVSTPNLATLTAARERLEAAGRTDVEVNAPGTTAVAVLPTLAAAGATQVEPGHGLTGTTPLHAVADLVEDPAICYVSEISHTWDGDAYVVGGGLYVDPVLGETVTDALVCPPGQSTSEAARVRVEMPAPAAIDYYAILPGVADRFGSGDTVVFGFRQQVFVTRSLTAGIRGIATGRPRIEGIWSADGSRPLGLDDIRDPKERAR